MKTPFSSKDPSSNPPRVAMTNAKLEDLIGQISQQVVGRSGHWKLTIGERDIWVITDVGHNRMRIMSPVVSQDELNAAEMVQLLEANFDTALDAKYALRDQTLWSVFTHPLGELTEEQFLDCVAQVANLADNYGSSYASSNLIFRDG